LQEGASCSLYAFKIFDFNKLEGAYCYFLGTFEDFNSPCLLLVCLLFVLDKPTLFKTCCAFKVPRKARLREQYTFKIFAKILKV